jgi:hypothetical protein
MTPLLLTLAYLAVGAVLGPVFVWTRLRWLIAQGSRREGGEFLPAEILSPSTTVSVAVLATIPFVVGWLLVAVVRSCCWLYRVGDTPIATLLEEHAARKEQGREVAPWRDRVPPCPPRVPR